MQSQSNTNTNRNSTGSAITIRGGHALPTQQDVEALRAISRASSHTDYTDADRTYQREFLASALGMHGTSDPNYPGQGLQEEEDARGMPSEQVEDAPQRPYQTISPNLEPANFTHNTTIVTTHGHQHPRLIEDEKYAIRKAEVKKNLGRNYEYFTGNTIFWLGGRLQNARDKPIVLATAIIIIVPSILFFVFS